MNVRTSTQERTAITRITRITRKQAVVLDAMRRLYARDGTAPSIREIARAVGRSQSTVCYHVRRLADKGFVRRIRTHYLPLPPDAGDLPTEWTS
jgi:DNA-binding MarR family transcriptional regulator